MSVRCGICNDDDTNKRLYCNCCASSLVLESRLSLLNVICDLSVLRQQVEKIISPDSTQWLKLYENTSRNLATRVLVIQSATKQVKSTTSQLRAQIEHQRAKMAQRKAAIAALKSRVEPQLGRAVSDTKENIKLTASRIDTLQYETEMKQLRLGRDICLLFGLKRARRKPDSGPPSGASKAIELSPPPSPPSANPDTVCILVGSVTVPDIGSVVQYSHVIVNTAIERISFLAILLSYYLGVQLPYDILLPQKSDIVLRIAKMNSKFSLHCDRRISSFAQHRAKEFETYATGLAMISLCITTIALHQGMEFPSEVTPQQVCQLDSLLTFIQNTLNGKIPLVKGVVPVASLPSVATVADYIITQAYLDINGHLAEWDVIDKDSISD